MSEILGSSAESVALKSRRTQGISYLPTVGVVEDNNDPDQRGRIQVRCPFYGDDPEKKLSNYHWAVPVSPLGGSTGGRAYGMWNVPQVGAEVLIICKEGNHRERLYLGELHSHLMSNTMPHGRYVNVDGEGPFGPYDANGEPIEPMFSNSQEALRKDAPAPVQGLGAAAGCDEDTPAGAPVDNDGNEVEGPPEPTPAAIRVQGAGVRSIMKTADGKSIKTLGEGGTASTEVDSKVPGTPKLPHLTYESLSRFYDTQVSAWVQSMVESGILDKFPNAIADHPGMGEVINIFKGIKGIANDLGISLKDDSSGSGSGDSGSETPVMENTGQGYAPNTTDLPISYVDTAIKYSPQSNAWVSAGFHAFSFDDRVWNKRVRLRSSGGNQMILDDTNERIYISSAKGNTWIQVDQAGTVDIYGAREVSMASDSDINMYSKKGIKIAAEEGVHITSEKSVHITAKTDIHLKSAMSTYIQSSVDINLKATAAIAATADGILSLKGNGGGYFETGCALHLKSAGPVYITGSEAHINSTPAGDAMDALAATPATLPSRIPEHEPWARGYADPSAAEGKAPSSGEDVYPASTSDSDSEDEYPAFKSGTYDEPNESYYDDLKPYTRGPYYRR